LLSEAQDRLITRLLGQAGVITPPAKAAYLTDVLGREVKSLSSITKREASKVIDRIREQPPAPAEEEAF
jgi:predicted transcriptional regulator